MAGTSERIIILSAFLLVVIIIWFPNSEQMRTIVTVNDVEVEIETSRDNYTLGESFTATVYFVNNGSEDIWMNPIIELAFLGSSLNDPEPNTGVILLDWGQGAMIHIPAKSKIKLFERDFESQYSGEFLITCLGAEKVIHVLEPVSNLVDKTRNFIVERVGEDYFDRYFTYWGLEKCTTEDWRYRVGFFYNIQVGNYTGVSEVCLWYDHTHSLIGHNGVPTADNLMPFNITREEAVDIAIEEVGSIGWVDVDAGICYIDELLDDTPLEKYVWAVSLYLNPRKAMSGSLLSVIIDPYTGTVIESERISWLSTP